MLLDLSQGGMLGEDYRFEVVLDPVPNQRGKKIGVSCHFPLIHHEGGCIGAAQRL